MLLHFYIFMYLPKRRVVMKAYINLQFGYCPLVSIMHSRSINNKINRIHERALRIAYKDKFATFEKLLEKSEAVKIHGRNLQVLGTETFKVKNNIAPKVICDIFKLSNPTCNLKKKIGFVSNHEIIIYFVTRSLCCLGPELWDLLPQDWKK